MQFYQVPFLAALASLSLVPLASAGLLSWRDESTMANPMTEGEADRISIGTNEPGKAAAATPKIHTIVVGSPTVNKSLVYTPNSITAAPGDILQFQFSQINHTVTQSTFAAPCEPIQATDGSAAGIHSGFIPVTANASTVETFMVPINDTKPLYLYCAQGPHCMLGMVMAVNAPANESFNAYKAAAAKATKNVPAALVKGGTLGSIPAAMAVPAPV